jgi:hypothetical protein
LVYNVIANYCTLCLQQTGLFDHLEVQDSSSTPSEDQYHHLRLLSVCCC